MDKPKDEQEVEKKIAQYQNRQKILLNKKRSEEHRARTHRLLGSAAPHRVRRTQRPNLGSPQSLRLCGERRLDEILAVLALCTPTQRERFLLYALYDYSYAEIGRRCGCSTSRPKDATPPAGRTTPERCISAPLETDALLPKLIYR